MLNITSISLCQWANNITKISFGIVHLKRWSNTFHLTINSFSPELLDLWCVLPLYTITKCTQNIQKCKNKVVNSHIFQGICKKRKNKVVNCLTLHVIGQKARTKSLLHVPCRGWAFRTQRDSWLPLLGQHPQQLWHQLTTLPRPGGERVKICYFFRREKKRRMFTLLLQEKERNV